MEPIATGDGPSLWQFIEVCFSMMNDLIWLRYLLIPLIGALIGWLTNALAVRMIFRPHRPLNLLGFKLQGLVPKRQPELAASIGHTVEKHLVSHEDVVQRLTSPEAREEIDQTIRERLDRFMAEKLKTVHPMAGMLLTGQIRDKLENVLMDELNAMMPELTEQMVSRLETSLNFQQIVEEKVSQFDLDRLEAIILEIASRELKAIEILGGVIGLLIGIVQIGVIALTG